jgi:uncharacterized protein (DUF4415 family)
LTLPFNANILRWNKGGLMPKSQVKKLLKRTRQNVSLRIDSDALETVDRIAGQEGRTRSNQIDRVIIQWAQKMGSAK